MNLLQALNTYLWVWLETLKGFRRPVVLVPFLLFALLEALILISSSVFYQKPWGYFWVPLLAWYPGPGTLHYPSYFLALPLLTARMDLVLGAVLGCLTTGWGALLFRQSYLGQREEQGSSLRTSLRRYGALLAVAAGIAALNLVLSWANASLPRAWLEGYGRRQLLERWLFYALNVTLQALALYVPVSVLLSGRRLGGALAEGMGLFWRHRVMTFFLVLLPFLSTLPLSLALENPALIATRFKPELLLGLCLASLAVGGLATMLLTGAAVRFYLYRTRQDRAPALVVAQGEVA